VVVKARIVKLNPQRGSSGPKMRGTASKGADAHLRYLERDGVTRDGEKGRAYSAFETEADGKAFIERSREDRHQFRFIVAPEDSADLEDLRGFTRNLMRQMEKDLDTGLDWIAVDHHNTGRPHTHILVRGVLDDGRILNIAGDYIAHGIRHRASDLVTRELGHQSEIELQTKLAHEVGEERLTRLDKMLIAEQREHGIVDLRPGESTSYLALENRHLLIGRVQRLEQMGLATAVDPGCWLVGEETEPRLRALGERIDIIKTIHRALSRHGLEAERGIAQYVHHGETAREKITGRVLAKGLAGDEMGERVYLVIDGVDGRVHHMEFANPSPIDEIRRGMIVEAAPAVSSPRSADRNIAIVAEAGDGIYRPSHHIARIRERFERQGKDPDAFVRFHIRRLEALRRAGHAERLDEDHWRVPEDIVARGQAYDLAQGGGDGIRVRTLATLDLERQITSDGATWLDRKLVAKDHLSLAETGFGREVSQALNRRAERLVETGHATQKDGLISVPRSTIAVLERQEVERVGRRMAMERGLTYAPSGPGEYVTGRLSGIATLASGRFAMLEDGLSFQLVPWQPVLDKRLNQYISGLRRDDGGIEWSLDRKRTLGLGL
jgi:type IV secretory pathway VirD2 relaxase